MTKELKLEPKLGWPRLALTVVMLVGAPVGAMLGVTLGRDFSSWVGGLLFAAGILSGILVPLILFGFQAAAPNDARVMLLFGVDRGSVIRSGSYWVNSFFHKAEDLATGAKL